MVTILTHSTAENYALRPQLLIFLFGEVMSPLLGDLRINIPPYW